MNRLARPAALGAGFRHEALLYSGQVEFVERASAFVRSSLEREEPVLVAVSPGKIRALRAALGPGAGRGRVFFVDMSELGRNPARIIPAWSDFVGQHAGATCLRGVGEPVWPGRSTAELAECERHELLLNLAFEDGPAWWLLCPYDTVALGANVVAQALRTHPYVSDRAGPRRNHAYRGPETASALLSEPLPGPPASCLVLEFEMGALAPLRAAIAREAELAGLDRSRTGDVVLAVHEIASNSVRHGGGRGTLRVWRETDALVCEVRDPGRIDDPLAGRRRPAPGNSDGRGLWLANQLCDLVQIRSTPAGSAVRILMRSRR